MEQNIFYKTQNDHVNYLWLLPGLGLAFVLGKMIAGAGILAGGALLALPFIIGYLIWVFLFPKVGLITFILYSFMMPGLGRHIVGPQFGLGIDALLILTWLGVIFHRGEKFRFRHLKN